MSLAILLSLFKMFERGDSELLFFVKDQRFFRAIYLLNFL